MPEAPEEVRRLAEARAARRAAGDFQAADALRDRILALGWRVVDRPDGFDLEPESPRPAPARVAPSGVPSVLEGPPSVDVSVHWLVEGWPEDVLRGVEGFRRHRPGASDQHVVVDAVGSDPSTWPEDVEVVALDRDHGWAADRNAGLRRAAGRIVVVADGSVEATGDAIAPLIETLGDPTVGVTGPFGIVTDDLREFREHPGPDVDAIEGYLIAFRREVLGRVGAFDERFAFYRSCDVEFSFRVKDAGLRAVVVPVPVTRHEHRVWSNTPEDERTRLSRRNFNRFLERFRDRFDLTVAGRGGDPGGRGSPAPADER